jgi:hypothetical protein
MGGVSGEAGERTWGVIGCCLSVFRYSGVGRRLKGGYAWDWGCTSSLDSEDPRLFLSFSFESLFPIPDKSGCGGAGRAGTGFRP